MGGYGSGWHGGTNGRPEARATVEGARRMDLKGMRAYLALARENDRRGASDPDGRKHVGPLADGVWTWKRGEGETASVGFALWAGTDLGLPGEPTLWLALDYTAGTGGGAERVRTRIPLDVTLGNGGGRRYWMRCPGLPVVGGGECDRRAAALYLPGGARRFACRTCHALTYTSCRESHQFDSLYRSLAAQMNTDARTVRRALKRL